MPKKPPPAKDLLDAVHAHHQRRDAAGAKGMAVPMHVPEITQFGEITVSERGVEIRDFSARNTPSPGDLPPLVIDWAIDRLLAARQLFGIRPHGIDKYADAIQHSLRSQNWFGALFLALAMPDICGALEAPSAPVGARYKNWFERYLSADYVPELFSGDDCYYLRCAALHQGMSEHPKAQNKQVVFITPSPGVISHSNFMQSGDGSFVLQLQIDIFCKQVCRGVQQWREDVSNKPDVCARIDELLEFQDPSRPLRSKA
jgi:hypothetical protein